MKVSKAQAQANRTRIIETASTLFRERGFDGVGVADLMAAAGFTHGGFYNHFQSKTELIEESAACGIAQTVALSAGGEGAEFIRQYLSRDHRDHRAGGCTMAALGSDAARQPEAVRAKFAEGIESVLNALIGDAHESDQSRSNERRAMYLDMLVHAVGAIVMSRACPDASPLADEILEVSSKELHQLLVRGNAASEPSTGSRSTAGDGTVLSDQKATRTRKAPKKALKTR